jgi:hypothetical protein
MDVWLNSPKVSGISESITVSMLEVKSMHSRDTCCALFLCFPSAPCKQSSTFATCLAAQEGDDVETEDTEGAGGRVGAGHMGGRGGGAA